MTRRSRALPSQPSSNPFFLVVRRYGDDGENTSVAIDLDTPKWKETFSSVLKATGVWFLCHRETSKKLGKLYPVLAMKVDDGEDPSYIARHIGKLDDMDAEIICYGIGKTLSDGTSMRLWAMPNGMVTGGEDVYELGAGMVSETL